MAQFLSPVRWLPVSSAWLDEETASSCVPLVGETRECPIRGTVAASECTRCKHGIARASSARDARPTIGCAALRPMAAASAASLVGEIMVETVVWASPDDSIDVVVERLLANGISGVPVLDCGRPVGIVSRSDLLRLTRMTGVMDPANEAFNGGLSWTSWSGLTARDVMAPVVLSVTDQTSIRQAASLMAYEGIHRVLVTRDERIVGIVTSTDLVRWVAGGGGHEPRVAPRVHDR